MAQRCCEKGDENFLMIFSLLVIELKGNFLYNIEQLRRNADSAMSLFLQFLGNGLVQGAVAVLYTASFGFLYRSFRVFHIAMGLSSVSPVMHSTRARRCASCRNPYTDNSGGATL